MHDSYDKSFPSLRLIGVEESLIESSEIFNRRLYDEYSSLGLGRGQIRECTRLAMALCAVRVRLCEDPDEGITLTDLHLAARAASAWMSTERLRRVMRLTKNAVPLYEAALRLAASRYVNVSLATELVFYVQRRQSLRFKDL